MADIHSMLKAEDDKMDKAVQTVDRDLKTLRTGRASTSMLDGIKALAYGTETPLVQLANISAPDATQIIIQPWDASVLAAIEKAIMGANLGLTPSNDGKIIRLRVPALTEETRKQIAKKAHEIAEQGRIAIRNIRRNINDEIKKTEKGHEITEDERKRLLDQSQKKTDAHIKKIDELMAKKEAEVMQV